jgi:hypothetical protein
MRKSITLGFQEGNMDFIERMFGVSPDGGNGVLEAVYFIVIGLVTFWLLRRRLRPRSGRDRRNPR